MNRAETFSGFAAQRTETWQTVKGKTNVTPKQHKMLTFIADYRREHGYGPTLKEIGAHIGSQPSNVGVMVDCMAKYGLVARDKGWRNVRVVDAA